MAKAKAVKSESVYQTTEVSVSDIYPNPNQPRKVFTQESLVELGESIKANGLMQPITVVPIIKWQCGHRSLLDTKETETVWEHFKEQTVAIIAYTAGIIDGEGCIWNPTKRPNKPTGGRFAVRIEQSISNNGEALIRWLRDTWGIGSINVSHKKWAKNAWDCWCWSICAAREVDHLLCACLPYLRVKRYDAEIAIEAIGQHIGSEARRFTVDPWGT